MVADIIDFMEQRNKRIVDQLPDTDENVGVCHCCNEEREIVEVMADGYQLCADCLMIFQGKGK